MDSPQARRRYAAIKLIEAVENIRTRLTPGVPLDEILPAVDSIIDAAIAVATDRIHLELEQTIGKINPSWKRNLQGIPLPPIKSN